MEGFKRKTESVENYLKRGGQIKKVPTPTEEPQLTVMFAAKAQPSFFELPVEEAISEALGLPLDNEVGSGSVYAFFQRQASRRSLVNRR